MQRTVWSPWGRAASWAQGCRGGARADPPRHRQVYQHWPEATRHPVPVLWDSAGAWQAERVRGGAEGGAWGGGCGRGRRGEHVWLGEREFRQSLPSLAVLPSRTLGPIAECAAFHTHTLRARGVAPPPPEEPRGPPRRTCCSCPAHAQRSPPHPSS